MSHEEYSNKVKKALNTLTERAIDSLEPEDYEFYCTVREIVINHLNSMRILEDFSKEMTLGERYTNSGQVILDAFASARGL